MKLEQIFEMWGEDSKIDSNNLGDEALKIASLHHKYHEVYTNERMRLRSLEFNMKGLKLDKYEFYTQGATKETQEKGWVLPPIGRVLKSDVQQYLDADKDLINLALKIGMAHEKIDLLESIIKSLSNRGYQIKTALDWARFTSGG